MLCVRIMVWIWISTSAKVGRQSGFFQQRLDSRLATGNEVWSTTPARWHLSLKHQFMLLTFMTFPMVLWLRTASNMSLWLRKHIGVTITSAKKVTYTFTRFCSLFVCMLADYITQSTGFTRKNPFIFAKMQFYCIGLGWGMCSTECPSSGLCLYIL